jgi:hypothetical protein
MSNYKEANVETYKVIIAGSRNYNEYKTLVKVCDNILYNKRDTHKIIIVSGAANGADKLGEKYARLRGYEIDSHPADWDKYGRSAGHIRNSEMGNVADAAIIFWDEVSPGSKSMIEIMRKLNKPYRIYSTKTNKILR